MITLDQAYSEITNLAKAAWDSGAASITGEQTKLTMTITQGSAPPMERVGNKDVAWSGPWARITVQHNEADTFAMGHRYRSSGTCYVNIFVPVRTTKAGLKAIELAKLIRSAFVTHFVRDGVEFSRVRVNEAPDDGPFIQVNVLADFAYNTAN